MDGGILSKFFGTNVPVIPDIKLDDLADLPDKPVQEEKKGQNIPGSNFFSCFINQKICSRFYKSNLCLQLFSQLKKNKIF